jgi:hypothetical protein
MQGPSLLAAVLGLLLGFALSYIGMWKQAVLFSKTSCDSGAANCQNVDFRKALQPTVITTAASFLLVWAAPNIWNATQGGGYYGGN